MKLSTPLQRVSYGHGMLKRVRLHGERRRMLSGSIVMQAFSNLVG